MCRYHCLEQLNSYVYPPSKRVGVVPQGLAIKTLMNKLNACRFFLKPKDDLHKPTTDPLLFRNLFFPCPEEIDEYEQVLQGDIYTTLMESIGLPDRGRGAFKTAFLSFLYNKAFRPFSEVRRSLREDRTWEVERIPEPVRQAMNALLPSIVFFLDLCKCNPITLKRKGGDHAKISHAIQSIESQIMLECCANLWKQYPKMFLTTLHDSIKCLPKDVPKVAEELARTFGKYRVSPMFEVEEHKRPSDADL